MRGRRRGLVLAMALIVGAFGSVTSAQIGLLDQQAQACIDPNVSMTLFAERISKKRIGYGLTPGNPTIPGPTIEIVEGDCLHVNLVNDTNVALSMHAHGVDYTTLSDGTPLNKSCVAPGRSRTYVFAAHTAGTTMDGSLKSGSAGYWHYHDHCIGGPHGTGGLKAGLFGAFIVRKADDPLPDRPPFVVVMGPGSRINLKKSPKTPVFKANEGERIEFAVIAHGDDFHTFHLHAHRWADNRTGIPESLTDDTQIIDNRTVGPADSFGFQVIAGDGVGPGAWMYHCHVQGHSDAGMSGILMVDTAGGQRTPWGQAALRAWRRQHAGHEHH